jgi:hypothetical protein
MAAGPGLVEVTAELGNFDQGLVPRIFDAPRLHQTESWGVFGRTEALQETGPGGEYGAAARPQGAAAEAGGGGEAADRRNRRACPLAC